jgi:hypothetical protein
LRFALGRRGPQMSDRGGRGGGDQRRQCCREDEARRRERTRSMIVAFAAR